MNRKKICFFVILTISFLLFLGGCGNGSPRNTFAGYPVVYLTSDVSARGMLSAYKALEPSADGAIGIKLSETARTGEFRWADLTGELIKATGASVLENDNAETDLFAYNSIIFLTHFEQNDTIGFYGTVAHLASISAQPEAFEQFESDTDERMKYIAEQGNLTAENLNRSVLYIAVLDRWSIGASTYDGEILASYDPVSLDQACVDLINTVEEYQCPATNIAASDGTQILVNAEQMGCGSRTYAFLYIDP